MAGVTGFARSLGLGLFSGARVVRGAAASPSPQRLVSVRESVSCPSLDLLTNTQVLDEAKQTAVSSCSGGCIRCCLTESISGEEIFRSDQRFLLQNICSSLERPMTNPAIVKQARWEPGTYGPSGWLPPPRARQHFCCRGQAKLPILCAGRSPCRKVSR